MAKKPTLHDKLDKVLTILTKQGTGPFPGHSGEPPTVLQPVPPKSYAEMLKNEANGDIRKFAQRIVDNAYWIYESARKEWKPVHDFMSDHPELFDHTGAEYVVRT